MHDTIHMTDLKYENVFIIIIKYFFQWQVCYDFKMNIYIVFVNRNYEDPYSLGDYGEIYTFFLKIIFY